MKYKNCKPYLIINNCRPGKSRLCILPQYHLADGHLPDGSIFNFSDYCILRLELDKPICTKIAVVLPDVIGFSTRDAMSVCTTLTYVYYTIFNLIKRQLTLAVHMLTTGL